MPASRPADDDSRRTEGLLGAGAFLLVFVAALQVARQGFSFLDDGVWLVGAERVLAGDALYRDVFTIYGPGKFVALALSFLVNGTSAVAMFVLEAATLAVAAAAGLVAARRLGAGRWALAVPVLVFGLGVLKLKIVWAAVMTVLWGLGLRRGLGPIAAIALGIGWGSVTWFGLDATLDTGIVTVGSLAILTLVGHGIPRPIFVRFAVAFVGTWLVPWVWALTTGSFDEFFWATIVYPLVHFRAEMSVPLLATLADTGTIGQPFATLTTGEALAAQWPAHEVIRAWGLRLLCVPVFVTPVLAIGTALRGSRDPLLLSLGLLAASSLLSLVTRGDEPHLLGTALVTTWLVVVAVARAPRPAGTAVAGLAVFALGSFVAENAWLATNVGREGLAEWNRDRARFLLERTRIESLEGTFGRLTADPDASTVFWPYQPGMNFVFDLPLGTPQITLLGGEVRDEDRLIDDLRRDPPDRVVVVRRFDIGGRDMRALAPDLWHYLRTNTRVVDVVTGTRDPAWVLRPAAGGWATVRDLPLTKRLPDRIQSTSDAHSPRLTGTTRIAQTFRVGDADLTGLAVRWQSEATGVTVPVEMILWTVEDGRLAEPLKGLRTTVRFDDTQRTSLFDFDPVVGTREEKIAVELRLADEVDFPVRLLWHEHTDEDDADLYPEGRALVDGAPVAADLYFATY